MGMSTEAMNGVQDGMNMQSTADANGRNKTDAAMGYTAIRE